MAGLCDDKRTIFMDCPVSGGVGAATAGMIFMYECSFISEYSARLFNKIKTTL